MPNFETIVTVFIAGFALSLSPGPSMFYILSRTLGGGMRAGIASAIGLCAGGILLAIIAAFGLGSLVETYPMLIHYVTIIGAIYLLYLAWQQFSDARANSELNDIEPTPKLGDNFAYIARQAVMVELLNPKTILFFALFLSPFLDPQAGDMRMQALVLGALVPLTAIPSDLTVVYMGNRFVHVARERPRLRMGLTISAGVILAMIGLELLFKA